MGFVSLLSRFSITPTRMPPDVVVTGRLPDCPTIITVGPNTVIRTGNRRANLFLVSFSACAEINALMVLQVETELQSPPEDLGAEVLSEVFLSGELSFFFSSFLSPPDVSDSALSPFVAFRA